MRTVASRYKGRIQAYEIWNEPDLRDFWSGTTDQMVTLTKEASQIIHTLDPSAIVVSPSATSEFGTPWLSEFLKKGGGQYVDVIGYHFYLVSKSKLPEELVQVVQKVRKVLTDNSMESKPLWNTESGWLQPARIDSDEVAAGVLARAYILSWAAGVQRFYWYAWDNEAMAVRTYNVNDHTVTPAGHAYKVMEEWLVGTRMDSCSESADHTWTCQFTRSGKKEWIVWNSTGNAKFDIPGEWHVAEVTPLLHDRHSFNGPSIDISPAPILITGRS